VEACRPLPSLVTQVVGASIQHAGALGARFSPRTQAGAQAQVVARPTLSSPRILNMALRAQPSKPSQPAKLRMRQKRLIARFSSMGVVLTKVIICTPAARGRAWRRATGVSRAAHGNTRVCRQGAQVHGASKRRSAGQDAHQRPG